MDLVTNYDPVLNLGPKKYQDPGTNLNTVIHPNPATNLDPVRNLNQVTNSGLVTNPNLSVRYKSISANESRSEYRFGPVTNPNAVINQDPVMNPVTNSTLGDISRWKSESWNNS
jgi:hypothetical protein